jgi:hypothetical protein
MASINDLLNVLKESRELAKTNSADTVTGWQKFTIGVPGAATTKFSLPSRCFYVGFVSATVPLYGFPVSSSSLDGFQVATTANILKEFKSPTGLDFSLFGVFAAAAQSGATLTAFVNTCATAA